MRKLYFSRNSFAKGARIVRDAHDQSHYLLVGRWGRRQDALSLYAIQGELLAEIKQTSLGLLPKFDLYYNRQNVGSISKTLGFWHEMIYVRKLRWIIMGSLNTESYRIYHGTDLVMTMRPVVTSNGEAFELEIAEETIEPICICVAAILDHWQKPTNRNRDKVLGDNYNVTFGESNYTLHPHHKVPQP
ncbi:hypothetical protein LFAB_03430 [Lactiplantibacillus fabifermentans T30PCM01]|uniref:Uncharacterized protein n=1 Tax=Lactiplantibacillus fabifermentans T30PCM01 TaxID=1400520 RepID=W6TAY8_9LACO|nr:hypothetical protein [Lactiplantibacillus fabifermentans]ETY75148.1 hypothetical protein LFAB_03430 [Lactiplantibacillus fabifermentans T30PCM01]